MTALAPQGVIFWRPAAMTLLLHAAIIYLMTVNWTARSEVAVKPRTLPRYVEARLVQVEAPKPKPAAPKAKSKPKPRPIAAKPASKPKPKPAVTKAAKTEPATPKPKPTPQRRLFSLYPPNLLHHSLCMRN